MRVLTNKNYWFSSSYFFFFFAAWSLWWSLYAIWLKSKIGLSGTEVGTIYSINSAVSLVIMLAFGVIQDKLGVRKSLIMLQGIILLCFGPFLIYVYEPLLRNNYILGAIVGAPLISAGFVSGCALLESFVERISRRLSFEFGPCRFWGSFGYAAATFVAGIFFVIDPHINFWLVSVMGFFFLLNNIIFNPQKAKTTNISVQQEDKQSSIPSFEEIFALFKMKKFWIFVFFVIGTMSFYNIYDQQLFPNFYTSFFNEDEGSKIYGYLNSFQVFLEATVMIIAPAFIYKIGPKKALILAAAIMIGRILGCATFNNVYIISVIKLLHALEIPLFVLAMFKYIVANFDPRLSSTLYTVGFNISSNVGVIILSAPVGILFDHYGYTTTFYALSVIVIVVTVISVFTLSQGKKLDKNSGLPVEDAEIVTH